MKLAIGRVNVTPLQPVFQGGYVQRKTVYEKVHDEILSTVFVLDINNEKIVWISSDISGTTSEMIDIVLDRLKEKGLRLNRNNLVYGGTHTHSGPSVRARYPYMFMYGEAEQANVRRMCELTADCVYQTYNQEGEEVHTKYSEVIIDGLYSNRNDKNKLSDKHEYMIGFFNKANELIGIFHLMSHHCTVLGPQNMELSADLFGALRNKLEVYFGCPVLMAQGNAGDMGNKQYRDGNDFEALYRLTENLFAQIINKYRWIDIDTDDFEHRQVNYHACYSVDYSVYKKKYEDFTKRLQSVADVDEIKLLTGWQTSAKFKMNKPAEEVKVDMVAEIIKLKELEIVLVPGELGSILGLKIKDASKAKLCFVWAYVNGNHLGYMIEKEAYQSESQESQTTDYPPGVCEEYVQKIIERLITK